MYLTTAAAAAVCFYSQEIRTKRFFFLSFFCMGFLHLRLRGESEVASRIVMAIF